MIMNKMMPVIMDDQFVRLAVIDDYSSFIWTTRFNTSGDFQLIVNVNEDNKSLFKKDYYVVRDDDENTGIIEDIMIQRNEDGKDQFIITGRFLDAIIARRIIPEQTTVEGKVSACIEELLNQNIIVPDIEERKIDNFIIQSYTVDTTMEAQYTGKNLLDTIIKICNTYGIGYKVTLNADCEYVFQLYEGKDRTYDQNVNSWVIFSDTYDNLLSSQYEECYKDIATAVLVGGQGEGLDRAMVWATDGSTGLNRHELFKDERNIRLVDGMPWGEYVHLLWESGQESLTTYTTAFTGTVYFDNITYKEDINVGDLCVIENARWGIYMNARLMEVIESVDEAGKYTITPSFGV